MPGTVQGTLHVIPLNPHSSPKNRTRSHFTDEFMRLRKIIQFILDGRGSKYKSQKSNLCLLGSCFLVIYPLYYIILFFLRSSENLISNLLYCYLVRNLTFFRNDRRHKEGMQRAK